MIRFDSVDTLLKSRSASKSVFNSSIFNEKIERISEEIVYHFRKLTRRYALFHMAFFFIGFSQVMSFLLFSSFFFQSSVAAFSLASLFLTGFSYFILRFYFQAKKPEELNQIRDHFVQACEGILQTHVSLPEKSGLMTRAIHALLSHLDGQEYTYYRLPSYFEALAPLTEKLSLWCHWKDLFLMKEILLQFGIRTHVERVKYQPTDIEAHAMLANSYIALYRLYIDPRKLGKTITHDFILKSYASQSMISKFQKTALRAIEELKIVEAYSPQDPWVHTQLGAIYHDLGQRDKEIVAYETLLRISPQDRDLAYRLGILYFQQGATAAGLKIYEQLKKAQDPKAHTLISFYDIEPLA